MEECSLLVRELLSETLHTDQIRMNKTVKMSAYDSRTSVERQEDKRVRRQILFQPFIDPTLGVKRLSIGLKGTRSFSHSGPVVEQ